MNKINNWKQFLSNYKSSKSGFINEKSNILFESSLSKIWQHIESDISFGVISPFRKYLSLNENLERYQELKDIVMNDLKLGYIEILGGFKEEETWVEEKTLFIPNITKQQIIDLGKKYDQYSVIYKDKDEFIEIGTNEVAGIGDIKNNFIKKGWDKNLTIDSDITKQFFSQLLKGSHNKKRFLFNLSESYLLEKVPQSFNEVSYHKNNKQTYIKLL